MIMVNDIRPQVGVFLNSMVPPFFCWLDRVTFHTPTWYQKDEDPILTWMMIPVDISPMEWLA